MLANENRRFAVLIDADNAQASTIESIKEAIESQKDDDGFASLADVDSYIQRISPDFDSRTYGAKKLGDLMKKQKYVEFIPRKDSHPFDKFLG